ncbi:MAG: hypothetical protein AAGE43_03675 [Pseudomonadota bacterium]
MIKPGQVGWATLPLLMTTVVLGVALGLQSPPAEAAKNDPPAWLLGDWVLNSERTHELQPEVSSGGGGGGGFGGGTISVGGVGIPLPGGGGNAGGGGSARDPRVLRCDAITVSMDETNVHFLYAGSGEETMKPGNDQGRKTSWNNRNKLTQKYTTNTRTVTKSYQLDESGALVVKVKINPKGSKAATHVRVFERPVADAGPASEAAKTETSG